jgi:hypothetical protein
MRTIAWLVVSAQRFPNRMTLQINNLAVAPRGLFTVTQAA